MKSTPIFIYLACVMMASWLQADATALQYDVMPEGRGRGLPALRRRVEELSRSLKSMNADVKDARESMKNMKQRVSKLEATYQALDETVTECEATCVVTTTPVTPNRTMAIHGPHVLKEASTSKEMYIYMLDDGILSHNISDICAKGMNMYAARAICEAAGKLGTVEPSYRSAKLGAHPLYGPVFALSQSCTVTSDDLDDYKDCFFLTDDPECDKNNVLSIDCDGQT